MTDKKISELTALGETPASADLFAIVDSSGATTKYVTFENLLAPITVDGTDAACSGNLAIGLAVGAGDGTLHVHTASAGTVTAGTEADDLVIENSDSGGISLLAPDNKTLNIVFGNASDNTAALLQWDYDAETYGTLSIGSAKPSSQFLLKSGNNEEAARIDASQRLLVGHTASVGHNGQPLEVVASATYGGGGFSCFSTTSGHAPMIDFNKSASNTKGTQTLVDGDDILGYVVFRGSDGTAFENAAFILGRTDGTPAEDSMPGRLEFHTTPDGSVNSVQRMQINSAGNIGIGLTPTANMVGLSIEAGLLTIKETTTPTADTNYGKIYCKSDNKLYFQDGAGAEHEIAYAP